MSQISTLTLYVIFSLQFWPVLQLRFSPCSHVNSLVYFTFIPFLRRQGGEGLTFLRISLWCAASRQWLVCRGVCVSLLLITSGWIMAPSLNKNIIRDASKQISVPIPINGELIALTCFFYVGGYWVFWVTEWDVQSVQTPTRATKVVCSSVFFFLPTGQNTE